MSLLTVALVLHYSRLTIMAYGPLANLSKWPNSQYNSELKPVNILFLMKVNNSSLPKRIVARLVRHTGQLFTPRLRRRFKQGWIVRIYFYLVTTFFLHYGHSYVNCKIIIILVFYIFTYI